MTGFKDFMNKLFAFINFQNRVELVELDTTAISVEFGFSTKRPQSVTGSSVDGPSNSGEADHLQS